MTEDQTTPRTDDDAPSAASAEAPVTPTAHDDVEHHDVGESEPMLQWDPNETVPFAPLNFVLIGLGIIGLIAGFALLPSVNRDATNWQGTASPLLIIGSYVLFYFGITLVREAAPPPAADE